MYLPERSIQITCVSKWEKGKNKNGVLKLKRIYLGAALGFSVILAACEEQPVAEKEIPQKQTEQETKPQKNDQEEEKVPSLTEQLQKRLSEWKLELPSWTAENSGHIGAAVREEKDSVEIQFYETEEPMLLNDPALANATKTALLTIQRFSSAATANEQIAFEQYDKVGGTPVDLGYGITGYQDAGAGSLFTSWNEGRWAIIARTKTDTPKEGEQLARQTVSYLEEHTLPIPYEHGSLHVDVDEQGSFIKWQKKELVYGLTAGTNAELLEWATLFK